MFCPHRKLGIPCDASFDTAKKAYRALAKKYHPDINKDPESGKKFIEIQSAFEEIRKADEMKLTRANYNAGKVTVTYTYNVVNPDQTIIFRF